jgi:predicted TIM-barrel fold metal-dependent hydrolase
MSAILKQWMAGNGFPDTLVIDGHIHIGEWPHAATFQSVDEAAVESVRVMDAHGVDAICALAGGYFFGMPDYHLGNDFLLDVWRRIPERLIPFMSVNPNDTREHVIDELKRMVDVGVRCIKLLNLVQDNYPGDGPNLMALYAFAAAHNILVFNHCWSEPEIRRIASEFPTVDFIFGHYFGGFYDSILKTYPNVYTNVWYYGPMGFLDKGIREVGADKFMLGSDGFLNCLSVGIGPVVFANISDDDKRLILGLTTARLLHKVGALPESLQLKYTRAMS